MRASDTTADWRQYQEAVAAMFRELDFEAGTLLKLEGARSSHEVDVVARRRLAGMDLTWIVECKYWKSKVSKVHVLALRSIAEDTGANLAVLISEIGFQPGAIAAAGNTNIRLATFDEFKRLAVVELETVRLHRLPERLAIDWMRYWELSKADRIDNGLRPDTSEDGYSGYAEMRAVQEVLLSTLANVFPPVGHAVFGPKYAAISSRAEALRAMEQSLVHLEGLLHRAESITRSV